MGFNTNNHSNQLDILQLVGAHSKRMENRQIKGDIK